MQNRMSNPIKKAPRKAASDVQVFLLSWGIGLLSGMATSAIAVMVAIAMGYLSLGVEAASAQELPLSPAATVVDTLTEGTPHSMIMLGPTSTVDALSTPTPTGLATSTPDYAATATQACYLFHSNMPGTPCPRYSTPTPVP